MVVANMEYDLIPNRYRPYKWRPYKHLVHPWYKVFVKGAYHFSALRKGTSRRIRTPYICKCNGKDYLTLQHLQRHYKTKLHERNVELTNAAMSLGLAVEETSPCGEEVSFVEEGTNISPQCTKGYDAALQECLSCLP